MNKVYGRNAVLESLKHSEREIVKLIVKEGTFGEKVDQILFLAKEKSIKIEYTNPKAFDSKFTPRSQGVILITGKRLFFSVLEMLKNADVNNEKPFILLLDRIQDIHNLGAILRTAAAFGIHGVIIPKHDSAKINEEAERISQGATNKLMINETANLKNEVDVLKENGLIIAGLTLSAQKSILDFNMPSTGLALILGNEATGIREGLLRRCDITLKIPMENDIESLNVSVSFAITAFKMKYGEGGEAVSSE